VVFILLIIGLSLLLVGGTALVRGASGIAGQYGISPLIVGLTVVAFGTSAPELVVNVIGALRNQTDIAFGNVVGSNLANMGLVLCVAALIKPMVMHGQIVRRELPLLLLGTSVLLVMTLDHFLIGSLSVISRSDALILLLLFGVFIYISLGDVMVRSQDPFLENINELRGMIPAPLVKGLNAHWVYVGTGITCLSLGGHLTITKGAELAHVMGLPPVVVGMLIVAIGTSLPELVTSIIAALKNESDLCLGNVIGSNIFNSLFVLPISALIRPLPVPAGGEIDILLTLAFSAALLLVFFFDGATMNRRTAFAILVTYISYVSIRALT
jgi:cation:H+ antiporter